VTEWRNKAAELAGKLREPGVLVSPQWREAIRSVPRHVLVPHFYVQNEDATWRKVDGTDDPDAWLDAIYSDETLITALADLPPDSAGTGQMAVSSSTMPTLMVRMLEALNVHDGDRVLEIGTGTGYNAALLSQRLGDDNVFSVDVDAGLVDLAGKRLASAGYTPTILARDGAQGLGEHGPYDRIISTCAVPAIPRPWIDQTANGGLILTDLKLSGMGGNLVLLERSGDTVSGRFLPAWAGFMNMRHATSDHTPRHPRRDHTNARERRTSAPLQPWDHTVPGFLAMPGMPPNLTYGWHLTDRPNSVANTWLSATDGSWCEAHAEEHHGTRLVVEGGPASLWDRIETAWAQWRTAGEPDWSRLGLTVTPRDHIVWLDEPDGDQRWKLSI
jgi:methyltransferase of ATP-grasp peptide maturase system